MTFLCFFVRLILRASLLLAILGFMQTVELIKKDYSTRSILSTLNIALSWTILRELEGPGEKERG